MGEQLYPFTKNRYFKKKRMRSVDFERDQAFADHKLSFLNHWVLGTGVAFGLGVQRIDSDSLLVEPGLAVDSQGRYLIVDEPTICRIRGLEGFDDVHGEKALLWLSYREEWMDPMFVADDEGQSTQYAVARERFSLSLREEEALPLPAAEGALLSEWVLFEDDELRVVQSIPRLLSAEQICQLQLSIQSFSLEPLELELYYAPKVPGFSGPDGQAPVCRQHVRVERGETVLTLPVCPVQPAQVVRITVEESGFSLEKRGVRSGLKRSFCEAFDVVSGDVTAALAARLRGLSPQELWEDQPLGVPIAGVRIIRYDDKALLDDIVPLGARNRASVPRLQDALSRVARRFRRPAGTETPGHGESRAGLEREVRVPPRADVRQMATGSLRLNAGTHMKAGSVLASDEITHGLGPGVVYVTFGVEHIYPVANSEKNRTDLLLGDVSLFEQASGTYDRDFDRGVRVHPDKGTFELAVRPRADLRQSSLRLRWFAWKVAGDVEKEEPAGILTRLTPDVIHVKPGELIAFTPVFIGGAARPCDFHVEGRRNGVITRDGVYTAPHREGLYQVFAQVRGKPEERANAFVIVEAEEQDHGQDSL